MLIGYYPEKVKIIRHLAIVNFELYYFSIGICGRCQQITIVTSCVTSEQDTSDFRKRGQ